MSTMGYPPPQAGGTSQQLQQQQQLYAQGRPMPLPSSRPGLPTIKPSATVSIRHGSVYQPDQIMYHEQLEDAPHLCAFAGTAGTKALLQDRATFEDPREYRKRRSMNNTLRLNAALKHDMKLEQANAIKYSDQIIKRAFTLLQGVEDPSEAEELLTTDPTLQDLIMEKIGSLFEIKSLRTQLKNNNTNLKNVRLFYRRMAIASTTIDMAQTSFSEEDLKMVDDMREAQRRALGVMKSALVGSEKLETEYNDSVEDQGSERNNEMKEMMRAEMASLARTMVPLVRLNQQGISMDQLPANVVPTEESVASLTESSSSSNSRDAPRKKSPPSEEGIVMDQEMQQLLRSMSPARVNAATAAL